MEEHENHPQREDNSDEEKDEMFEQNEHTDDEKDDEERPIGANSDEWKADKEIHREVSKTIKEIQEEEGEALPTPEEFAPWYPKKEEAEKPTKRNPEKGGVPTTTHARVDKILESVMNHTKANISIGQLLEIAPYCKKRVMAALNSQEDELEKPASSYQVTTKAFDEEMPMISIIIKSGRVPNVLIDGGSGVNIITYTLRRKLGLNKIEPAPFTIKMVDQRKVMPKGIIRDVRLDVGGIVIRTTLTVIDMVSTEDSYSMLLGRPWLKEAQAQHDWPPNKLTLTQGGSKVELSTQRTPTLPLDKRPLHWEDYDWEMGLSDEEEAIVYEAFPELLPMGDFDLKNLRNLQGSNCNTVGVDNPKKPGRPKTKTGEQEKPRPRKATKKEQEAMEEKPVYPNQFYKVKEGDITVDITPAAEAVKGKKIAGWTVEDEDLVKNLNLGTLEDPKLVKIAKDLGEYGAKVKDLLLCFKDVFAFTYKDMKGIPPYVCEHKIELQPEAKPV